MLTCLANRWLHQYSKKRRRSMGYIASLVKSACALLCFALLLAYDFISLCRVIGKLEIVKKMYMRAFPDKVYNEEYVCRVIRPLLLQASMVTFLVSYEVFELILVLGVVHGICLMAAGTLSFLNLIKSLREWNKKTLRRLFCLQKMQYKTG